MLRVINQDEIKDIDSDIPSAYGPAQAEGLVIKAYGGNRRLGSDAERIVHKYVTDARIMKVIYRHTDDDEELHMKFMMFLPEEVWLDVIEECAKELLTSNFIINMREIKKLINRKCVEVLKMAVNRNDNTSNSVS